MVANTDVPMYLLSLKSFYPQLGRGKVAAIIDRDMPQVLRDTLTRHIPGIEFVILEDIPTGACQRGGTWERLLYVLDRSESEYTIQIDADTLTVGDDLDEVVRCVETNTPFTMTDGFELLSLPEVAEEAEATPSNYIGIIAERMFARYPDAGLHYVRGSSGFAGFSRGGFTRAAITRFHQKMEKLVGVEAVARMGNRAMRLQLRHCQLPRGIRPTLSGICQFHAARRPPGGQVLPFHRRQPVPETTIMPRAARN